ncbi:hypothetical protein SAMN05216389_12640, partial [Oceanobacillus limi]
MTINNLIVNGSFETGDFTGWEVINADIISEFAHSGNYSARLANSTVAASLSQIVPAEPGEAYELLVSLSKSNLQQSPTILLQVLFLDDANNVVAVGLETEIEYGSIPVILDDTWLEVYQTTDVSPTGTTQAQVIISKPISSLTAPFIYVDDVSLLDVSDSGAPGPTGPTGAPG